MTHLISKIAVNNSLSFDLLIRVFFVLIYVCFIHCIDCLFVSRSYWKIYIPLHDIIALWGFLGQFFVETLACLIFHEDFVSLSLYRWSFTMSTEIFNTCNPFVAVRESFVSIKIYALLSPNTSGNISKHSVGHILNFKRTLWLMRCLTYTLTTIVILLLNRVSTPKAQSLCHNNVVR